MRRQLAATPADVVIANHCYGLFELAAVYLSQTPPMLPKARLAIDAMTAVVEGLEGRLGDSEPQLLEGLSQLRLAYVQIDGAQRAAGEAAGTAPANGAPAEGAGAQPAGAQGAGAQGAGAQPTAAESAEAEPGGAESTEAESTGPQATGPQASDTPDGDGDGSAG